MNRKPAVQVPDVPGIDLDYRPRDYFWAAGLKVLLPSSIAGETRRQMVRALVEAGSPVPDGLDAAVLDEKTRAAWGRLHPSDMGESTCRRFARGRSRSRAFRSGRLRPIRSAFAPGAWASASATVWSMNMVRTLQRTFATPRVPRPRCPWES